MFLDTYSSTLLLKHEESGNGLIVQLVSVLALDRAESGTS